ncbi:EndoU domain-containing protein [Streptomyces sp. NA04227]|uniref:EndoU domain-containing protein n=1 Tax=Streptomyces sp. NA04227 TaxID=2742136 RepID=UPI0015902AF7|nr:EndoU domain-containing protein [Streptomyces sp. NA04227]QKW06206.1 EndoU domain-containing protein [Streptomyces sp. NA04227]
MSDAKLIVPDAIPQFTGDVEELTSDVLALTGFATLFRHQGAQVHQRFQGLSACYEAPEAEQLFATTKPVETKTDAFADQLGQVASALRTYGDEVAPLAKKLRALKTQAALFVANDVDTDEDWREDKDKVDLNNDLWHDVNATVEAFEAAEAACHNKITALVGGIQVKPSQDGTTSCGTYGFEEGLLDKAGETPWGVPVEREYTGLAWVGHQAKSYVWDGFVIDGVVGTVKGLGTLFGKDGWGTAGQAWLGLAKLGNGLALTLSPAAGAYWLAPADKLPPGIQETRTALKETGKALIAYDQWSKNPSRAAGAVTFNVLTTVATGGAGVATKSGAAAKAVAAASRVARAVDPVTYVVKAGAYTGAKVGDLFGRLKTLGTGGTTFDALSDLGRLQADEAAVPLPSRVAEMDPNAIPYRTASGEIAYMVRGGPLVDESGKILQHLDEIRREPSAAERAAAHSETPTQTDLLREPALTGARAGDEGIRSAGRTIGEWPSVTRPDSVGRDGVGSTSAESVRGPMASHDTGDNAVPGQGGSGAHSNGGGASSSEAHVRGGEFQGSSDGGRGTADRGDGTSALPPDPLPGANTPLAPEFVDDLLSGERPLSEVPIEAREVVAETLEARYGIPKETLNHVLFGEVKDGAAQGWHVYDENFPDRSILPGTLQVQANGVRFSRVAMRDLNGNWVVKNSMWHTFFPADWTVRDLVEVGKLLEGQTPKKGKVKIPHKGLDIVGLVDSKGLATFFPRKGGA